MHRLISSCTIKNCDDKERKHLKMGNPLVSFGYVVRPAHLARRTFPFPLEETPPFLLVSRFPLEITFLLRHKHPQFSSIVAGIDSVLPQLLKRIHFPYWNFARQLSNLVETLTFFSENLFHLQDLYCYQLSMEFQSIKY